jgi:hypothetical protein
VSPFPCSNCGGRVKGRLATLYNRWPGPDGEWERCKQRLCVGCATALLGPLKAGMSLESSDVCVCPICAKDSSGQLSPIYLSVYLPKQEPREYALTTCESCATTLRDSLRVGSSRLANREGFEVGAPGPNPEDWSHV